MRLVCCGWSAKTSEWEEAWLPSAPGGRRLGNQLAFCWQERVWTSAGLKSVVQAPCLPETHCRAAPGNGIVLLVKKYRSSAPRLLLSINFNTVASSQSSSTFISPQFHPLSTPLLLNSPHGCCCSPYLWLQAECRQAGCCCTRTAKAFRRPTLLKNCLRWCCLLFCHSWCSYSSRCVSRAS